MPKNSFAQEWRSFFWTLLVSFGFVICPQRNNNGIDLTALISQRYLYCELRGKTMGRKEQKVLEVGRGERKFVAMVELLKGCRRIVLFQLDRTINGAPSPCDFLVGQTGRIQSVTEEELEVLSL